jgi:hypothetical protein
VEVYDSLDNRNLDVGATFTAILQRVQKEVDNSHWQAHNRYKDATVQREIDGHSCAFFTRWYAYKLVKKGTIGTFENDYMESNAAIAFNIVISLIEGYVAMWLFL